jgi:uncharacterized membrane protein YhhN
MKGRIFIILYVLVAGLQLLSRPMGWDVLHVVSKSLLVPLLACFYATSVVTRSTALLAALFFCWLGDVILIFPDYFLAGLGAFLIGHVMYILSYRQHQWEDTSRELLVPQKIRYSLPVILSGTGLVVVLLPALGGMTIPVLVYAIVIVVMVMTAMFRFGRTNSPSFWLVFGGAIIFMTSDSILAINKFMSAVPLAEFWIMSTYMIAQIMIVVGIARHEASAGTEPET